VFNHSPSRLVVIPLLILLGFISMFGVVELRRQSNEDQVRLVLSDPIPKMARNLFGASAQAQTALAQYHLLEREDPASWVQASEALKHIETLTDKLLVFLERNEFEFEEHGSIFSIIKEIKTNATQLSQMNGTISKEAWAGIHHHLGSILFLSEKLIAAIDDTHQEETAALFKKIENDEKARAVLAIFVLIGGFIVILSLFDLVYHYKTSADRAKAAEKYNALFAAALQNTRVGVLIRDMRRERFPVVFINKAFTRITGYEFEDLTGESSDFLFGWNTDQVAITAFRRAIHFQETTMLDVLLYKKDGSPFWSEWHLTPLLGDDQKPAYFVSLLNDVSAIKQTQDDLMQAKMLAEHASAVKTTFLAMMSHEIRTPINGILGVLKLLSETGLDPEQKHLLGIASTSSSALHGIINDILDYAKMEAGKIEIYHESFDLRDLVSDIAGLGRTLLGDKKIEIQVDIDAAIPGRVVADIGRIRQILLNLVSNAAKFTETGSIKIRIFPLMQQEIEGKPGFLMRFEVQDTGMGISAEDQTKLFQEFSQIERSFTRRFGGTGLGLAICRRLVTMMKGEMDVESFPGKGSKFWFMLPIQEISAAELEPEIAEAASLACLPAVDLRSIHVLLVEDNDTNRLVAKRYIEKIGLTVDEAVNGLESITKAKAKRYNIILMDVSMPEMDGMMATCQIRALGGHNATVPIVALTAHAMLGDRQLCLAAGMNDYLNKPIDYKELVQTLQRWLRVRLSDFSSGAEEVKKPASVGGAVDYSQFPAFERQVLAVMQRDLGGSAVAEVTRIFLEDSARRMALFERLEAVDDIQDAAHTLKSCSANCGLIQFSKMMADLERACSVHDKAKIAALVADVGPVYETSRAVLEREREKYLN